MDDERRPTDQRTKVTLFESEEAQLEQLLLLSVDMLTMTRNQDRPAGVWPLLLMGLLFTAILMIIAMAKKIL